MSYLVKITVSKPSWLCVFLITTLVGVNSASAKGWVISSSASKKTLIADADSTSSSSITSIQKHLETRALDRGVLVVRDDGGSAYRSSGYKSSDAASVFSTESSYSYVETSSSIIENSATESSYSDVETSSSIIENLEASRSARNGIIYPIAQLSLGYRSGVYETNGNGFAEEKGAATLLWGVGGGYQGSNRDHLNGLEYLVQGNEFLSGGNDENEVSHRLNGYWGTAFTPRNHLDLGIEYVDTYDPRGKGDSLQNIRFNTSDEDADRWTELTGGGVYSFGHDIARGRLELGAHLTKREYDNNQQQYRNRDALDVSAKALFKIMAKTEFYAQVVYSDFDYVDQAADDPSSGRDLDSEETRYMLGLQWYPSEKLSGTLRVGTVEKTFQPISQAQDYDELTWDSSLRWSPNARNSFGLVYSRAPREAFVYTANQLLDDYIEIENLYASWSHLWGQRFSTSIGYTLGQDSFLPSGRKDDRDEFSIGLSYELARWGAIGLTYYNRKRDSNVANQDYDDDGISLYFNLGAALGLGDGNTRAPGVRNQRQYRPGYAVY